MTPRWLALPILLTLLLLTACSAPATPAPTPAPPTLQVGEQRIPYRIAGDQLTLLADAAPQTLAFPADIAGVSAAAIPCTLRSQMAVSRP